MLDDKTKQALLKLLGKEELYDRLNEITVKSTERKDRDETYIRRLEKRISVLEKEVSEANTIIRDLSKLVVQENTDEQN